MRPLTDMMHFVIMSGRLRHRRPPYGGQWGVARLAPVILTVFITGLAFSTPREIAVSRLLPAAPALAAAMWPVLPTILLGTFCLLVMISLSFFYTDLGTQYTGAAIIAVTLAAAYASHVRLQREEILLQVRLVADAAQKVLLRPLPRRIENVEMESLYLAAQEQARIGGDFYEAAGTRYGVRLLIGDVRGKGLSAVGAASAVINCFREAAYDEPDLRGIIHRLETSIARHSAAFPTQDRPEHFATALIAEIPRGGGHVRLLNCGHPRRCLRIAGRSASWSPPPPRRPSTSRRSSVTTTGSTPSPSARATNCCSIRTAYRKPGTAPASSFRCPTGCSGSAQSRPASCSTGFTGTCSSTAADGSTTTSRPSR